ncbi:MAG: biotin/lipoyl-containing protein [Bacillota bacterium]
MKTFKVTVDGQSYTVQVEEVREPSSVSSGSVSDPVSQAKTAPVTEKPQEKNIQAQPVPTGNTGASVKAPMPGSILEVKVSAGEEVKEGDVLLVLEAMKMENELTASQAGTVSEVLVKKGDTVNSGDPLVVLS